MTKRQIVLVVACILSLIATVAILSFVVSGSLSRSDRAGDMFLAAVIINAVALLIYLRAIRLNQQLSASQKEHWIIAVVLGMGFGQVAYFVSYGRRL